MAVFPRPAHPRVVWRELRAAFSAGNRRDRLVLTAMAIGMTSLIVTGFILEAKSGIQPEGTLIIYAEDFKADRTDAEIIAQQKIDQKKREAKAEARRQSYKKVDDALTRWGL